MPFTRCNPRDSANNQYFNPSAFASNLSCGYETCGVTGSARQYSFSGPGPINTDLGLEKDTRITESMAFNVRFEMFNVFNHANFLTSRRGRQREQQPVRAGHAGGAGLASVRSAASSSSNPVRAFSTKP